MKLERDEPEVSVKAAAPSAKALMPGLGNETDQQIIDAIVGDERALLHELSLQGVSREAVRSRAVELGLTNEFIRQCRLSGSRPAMRVCIKCDAAFLSAGTHNRLCRRCVRS